jgi:hypothetical protein
MYRIPAAYYQVAFRQAQKEVSGRNHAKSLSHIKRGV